MSQILEVVRPAAAEVVRLHGATGSSRRGLSMRVCGYCGQQPDTETPCAVCRAPKPVLAPSLHRVSALDGHRWVCTRCQRTISAMDVYAEKKLGESPEDAAGRLFAEQHGGRCAGGRHETPVAGTPAVIEDP